MRWLAVLVAGLWCGCTPGGFPVVDLGSGEVPSSITLSLYEGATSAPPTPVELRNTGTCDMAYTVAAVSEGGWLSATPTMGTVVAGASAALSVVVDPTSLAVRRHTGTLEVSARCVRNDRVAVGSPYRIAVNVTVLPALAELVVDGGYVAVDPVFPDAGWRRSAANPAIRGGLGAHQVAYADGYVVLWPDGGTPVQFDPFAERWSAVPLNEGLGAVNQTVVTHRRHAVFLSSASSPTGRAKVTRYDPRTRTVVGATQTASSSHVEHVTSAGDVLYGMTAPALLWRMDLAATTPDWDFVAAVPSTVLSGANQQEILAWTGRELFFECSFVGGSARAVLRFDAATETFRRIALLPRVSLAAGDWTWTGRELIVMASDTAAGQPLAYTYDFERDDWQPLPTTLQPELRTNATVVWTGAELFVWGGRADSFTLPAQGGAFFDPARRTWRAAAFAPFLPPPGQELGTSGPVYARDSQAVWTGTSVVWFERDGSVFLYR